MLNPQKSWYCVVLAYLVALALPAVWQPGFGSPTSGLSGSVRYGYECLGSLPFACLSPAWWANPIWIAGVIALARRNHNWALWSGLLATLLALSVFVTGPFPPDNFRISDFRVGYYVWLGSMIALWVSANWELKDRLK